MFDEDEDLASYEKEESLYSPDPDDFKEIHDRLEELSDKGFILEMDSEIESSKEDVLDENQNFVDEIGEEDDEDELLNKLKALSPEDFEFSGTEGGSADVVSEKSSLAPPSGERVDGGVPATCKETGSGKVVVMPAISSVDLVSEAEFEELKKHAESGAQFDEINGQIVKTGEGVNNEELVATEAQKMLNEAFDRVKNTDDALRFMRNGGLTEHEMAEVEAIHRDIEQAIMERNENESDSIASQSIKNSLNGGGKSR